MGGAEHKVTPAIDVDELGLHPEADPQVLVVHDIRDQPHALDPRQLERFGSQTGRRKFRALFDNRDDNLTLSRFQTFDFEGMDKAADQLEPLLFYILHRASAVILGEYPRRLVPRMCSTPSAPYATAG